MGDEESASRSLQSLSVDLDDVFASISNFVTIIDADGVILGINHPVRGLTHADVVGRPMFDFIDPAHQATARSAMADVLRRGEPSSYVSEAAGPDGATVWYENHLGPVLVDGQVVAITVVGTDISEQRVAQERLQRSEARFRTMFEHHDAVMLLIDAADGRIVDANRAAERFYGYSGDDLRRMVIDDINVLEPEEVADYRQRAMAQAQNLFVFPHRLASGEERTAQVHSSPVDVGDRRLLFSIIHDITEQRRAEEEKAHLEAQLLHAQKMEAVGRLAGGVAHDFNNLLTVIMANAALALERASDEVARDDCLRQVRGAAERAAELTGQLLAFSRKQVMESTVVSVEELLAQLSKLLSPIVGEHIELSIHPPAEPLHVHADGGQIEQVLVNLAVNARDAMPRGGSLVISALGEPPRDEHRGPAEPAGAMAVITVTDTGCGMDEETLQSAFEPFFTTKPQGEGTGLGLSTAFGIVEQHGGSIDVESRPGRGTTFEISLPAVDPPEPTTVAKAAGGAAGGDETLLVVEDDPEVLDTAARILRRSGYTVLTSASPADALELVRSLDGPIDLVISDVIMPGMNGRELAAELLKVRPELELLFVSGYSAEIIASDGMVDTGLRFLAKPYTPESLSDAVRRALDDDD